MHVALQVMLYTDTLIRVLINSAACDVEAKSSVVTCCSAQHAKYITLPEHVVPWLDMQRYLEHVNVQGQKLPSFLSSQALYKVFTLAWLGFCTWHTSIPSYIMLYTCVHAFQPSRTKSSHRYKVQKYIESAEILCKCLIQDLQIGICGAILCPCQC